MSDDLVTIEIDGGIADVRLNRPLDQDDGVRSRNNARRRKFWILIRRSTAIETDRWPVYRRAQLTATEGAELGVVISMQTALHPDSNRANLAYGLCELPDYLPARRPKRLP